MTTPVRAWLPPLLDLPDDQDDAFAMLHAVFTRDFVDRRPSFRGCPVVWDDRRDPGDPYERGFIHIISKDGVPLDRLRASKLCWCCAIILNAACPTITVWDYQEGTRKTRTYLWLEDCDYVVVLERMMRWDRESRTSNRVYELITAYHVEGDSTRRSLKQKWSKRCA
jgi:hypothetical protein